MNKLTKLTKYRYSLFLLGTFFTTLGNSLAMITDVGTAPWSAFNLNFSNLINKYQNFFYVSPGTAFNITLVVFFIFNKFMTKETLKLKKDVLTIIYAIFIGIFIDMFTFFLTLVNLPLDFYYLNVFYSFFGTYLIGFALVLFIYANVLYLPIDDFVKNISNIVFKGSVSRAAMFFFFAGLTLSALAGFFGTGIVAINYITIIVAFTFGTAINFFEKLLSFIGVKLEKLEQEQEQEQK